MWFAPTFSGVWLVSLMPWQLRFVARQLTSPRLRNQIPLSTLNGKISSFPFILLSHCLDKFFTHIPQLQLITNFNIDSDSPNYGLECSFSGLRYQALYRSKVRNYSIVITISQDQHNHYGLAHNLSNLLNSYLFQIIACHATVLNLYTTTKTIDWYKTLNI